MSLGWVIFWKCIVVAVYSALMERWAAFKEQHRAKGLSLRFNKRTGIYEAYDPIEKFERIVRRVLIVFAIIIIPYAALVIFVFLNDAGAFS